MSSQPVQAVESVVWLQSRLQRAGARHFVVESISLVLTVASVIALSLATYALADYIVNFPRPVRGLLTLGLLAGTAFAVCKVAGQWVRRLRTSEDVARAVERIQEKKGQSQQSTIISALQFGERPAISGSVVLKNVVIRQAREDCVSPTDVVLHDRRHVRLAGRVAIAAIVVLSLWIALAPTLFRIFLARAIAMNVPYPTATRILFVEWKETAPARQDYRVRVTAEGKLPTAGSLTVKYEDRRALEIPLQPASNSIYTATILGPEKPFWFRFTLGDFVSERYAVDVRIPPTIKEGVMEIQPPAYTKLPLRKTILGNATVPEGSLLTFRVTPTLPIKYCHIVTTNHPLVMPRTADGSYLAQTRVKESFQYAVHMIGEDLLDNGDRSLYYLNVVKDAPPKIEVARPKPNSFVSELSVLQFEFEIKDDYGITSASLEYQVFQKRDQNEVQVRKGAFPVELPTPGKTSRIRLLKQMRELAAAVGERIAFKVVALDNHDGAPVRGESDPVAVFVVPADELRRVIESEQARTAALMRKLRDDEKKQADAIQRRMKEGSS